MQKKFIDTCSQFGKTSERNHSVKELTSGKIIPEK